MQYERLVPARLLNRYKRFLGDVTLIAPEAETAAAAAAAAAAEEVTAAAEEAADAVTVVHVPNTGPMTGLLDQLPAEALLTVSADPKRKHAHTLEWVKAPGVRCAALRACAGERCLPMCRCALCS